MNVYEFEFAGAKLQALPSGGLWWPDQMALVVSDLHFGKSERIARRGGAMLPPYEVHETLSRLEADIHHTGAQTVICLGDSFDDLDAINGMQPGETQWITRLQAGRKWIWIEGNHDPAPFGIGGTHRGCIKFGPLTLRHIAEPKNSAEVSGHYHPKASLSTRGRRITRACFLVDSMRVILPAYGTYTGGLHSHADALCGLMQQDALAILTGPTPRAIPMPRGKNQR